MAKEHEDVLFEESSRGKVGASRVVLFALAAIMVFGGMVVMSYGFNSELSQTAQFWIFTIGQMTTLAGFAIPFGLPYASTVKTK